MYLELKEAVVSAIPESLVFQSSSRGGATIEPQPSIRHLLCNCRAMWHRDPGERFLVAEFLVPLKA